MDDEQKITQLKRASIGMGVVIVVTFSVTAVFGYYNCSTERPAKDLFYGPSETLEDHSVRPDK